MTSFAGWLKKNKMSIALLSEDKPYPKDVVSVRALLPIVESIVNAAFQMGLVNCGMDEFNAWKDKQFGEKRLGELK